MCELLHTSLRRLVPCSKCHTNRISEIALVVQKVRVRYRSNRHGWPPVTHVSQPSPDLAVGAFSLLGHAAFFGQTDASWMRRAAKKAPPVTNNASTFSRAKLSKAASIPRP